MFNSEEFHSFRARSRDVLANVESPFEVQLQSVLPQIYQGLQNLQRTVLSSNEQSRQTIQQSMLDMERRLQNSQVLDAARLAAVSRTVRNCSEEVTRVLQAHPDSLAEPLLLPPVIASSSQPALETIPRYLLSIYVFVQRL